MINIVVLIFSLIFTIQANAAVAIWGTEEGFGLWLSEHGFQLSDQASNKQYRNLTVDPSAGAGVAAPIGSLGVRDNSGVGEGWFKIGAADTAWSNFLTGATGWGLFGNSGTTAGTNFLGTTDAVDLVFKTDDTERFRISSTGDYDTTLGTGLVHSDSSGILSSSLLVNSDVDASAAIARSKLANGTAHQVVVNDASGVLSGIGPLTDGQLVIGSTGNASVAAALTGTANQVNVTNGAGSITLSTPQDIATTSSPTFGGLTLTGESGAAYFSTGVLDSEAQLSQSRGGTGLDTSGVTNGQLLIGGTTSNDFQLGTLTGTSDQVNVTNGNNSITLSLPQSIATGSSPSFTGLTVGTLTGPLRGASGVLGVGNLDLATEVTGTLAVGNGGTGVTALSDVLGTANQVSVSGGTARVVGGNVTLSLPQDIAATSNVQFGTSIIGAGTIEATAALQVNSTTKGFLPPRMTETERDAIVSPAEGLQIHNTTTNASNYFNGTNWVSGLGDVVGPASSVSGNLPSFADTSGKLLQDSGYSIESGTYTPTLTNETNISSITFRGASYIRIGDIVTVSLSVTLECTTSSGDISVINITLPVLPTNNFAADTEIFGGGGAYRSSTVSPQSSSAVIANVAAKTANMRFNCQSTTATRHGLTFSYSVNN